MQGYPLPDQSWHLLTALLVWSRPDVISDGQIVLFTYCARSHSIVEMMKTAVL